MPTPNQTRAAAHYSALAAQAEALVAAPQPGRELVLLPWGQSDAFVEAEPDDDHGPAIHRVLLNGRWVDVDGVVPELVIEQWLQRLRCLRTLSIAVSNRAARWAA